MSKRDDLQDLLPDRDVPVRLLSGRQTTVEVRAYRASEYFEARALARPVLDELSTLELDPDADTESLLAAADAAFARHGELMRELVALAVADDLDWQDLGAEAFRDLFYATLDANHAFFFALLQERTTLLTMALQMLRQSVTPGSSPNSSARASAARPRKSPTT